MDSNSYQELERRVAELEEWRREVMALIGKPTSIAMPFSERLPRKSELHKVRADLFDNGKASKGSTRYMLKVFVWTTDEDRPHGTMQPVYYPLHGSAAFKPEQGSYAQEVAHKLDGDIDVELIGKLTHQGGRGKGFTGRKAMHDHVAVLYRDGDLALLTLPEDGSERERLDLKEVPVAREQGDNAAIRRWYWKRD